MLKIVTWNVNSIKSRLQHTKDYLASPSAPDILLLQELKCETAAFPQEIGDELGYNMAIHGQKTYNGVAVLSKHPIDEVITTLPGEEEDTQARYIETVISYKEQALRVASVYVPNGADPTADKFAYKMRFFDRLHRHIDQLLRYEEMLAIGGDYNVAPEAIDVYDPKTLSGNICFHPDEHQKWRSLTHLGLTDAYRAAHPGQQGFTWWDYRGGGFDHNKGLRIDHILLSPEAADKVSASGIDTEERGKEKPSDHAPLWCELDL